MRGIGVYGFEFARSDTREAFYLVLKDEWYNDLAARPGEPVKVGCALALATALFAGAAQAQPGSSGSSTSLGFLRPHPAAYSRPARPIAAIRRRGPR